MDTQTDNDAPPKSRGLSGPWAATLVVLAMMVGLMLRMSSLDHFLGGRADREPIYVLAVLFVGICTVGVAIGWFNHFKAIRAHRNRRKPLSLS